MCQCDRTLVLVPNISYSTYQNISYLSKSGLIHEHIVKHIVKPSQSEPVHKHIARHLRERCTFSIARTGTCSGWSTGSSVPEREIPGSYFTVWALSGLETVIQEMVFEREGVGTTP